MTANTEHPSLLDLPPLTAEHFAAVEDKVASLLRTRCDVVAMQGEALLPLEACIRAAAPRGGSTALNVVTGPYGETFGGWLRSCGAEVVTLTAPFTGAVGADEVARALREHPETGLVSLVHAEAATGNTNPVAEIGAVVREHGALLMLDAVASVGAEPLLTDAWGVDLCVIGGQKALAGPAGVSAVSVSARAWDRIAANEGAPRGSYLSLLDWKERWLDGGRKALPHAPAQLEMLALEAAVDRVLEEGLDSSIARHRAASAATRARCAGTPGAGRVCDAGSGRCPGRDDAPRPGGRRRRTRGGRRGAHRGPGCTAAGSGRCPGRRGAARQPLRAVGRPHGRAGHAGGAGRWPGRARCARRSGYGGPGGRGRRRGVGERAAGVTRGRRCGPCSLRPG